MADLQKVTQKLMCIQAEKLLKASGSGNDGLMVTIWNKIGDHHADRHKWHKVMHCQVGRTHQHSCLSHTVLLPLGLCSEASSIRSLGA